MDTRELDTILRVNVDTRETFLGVYALDHLPSPSEVRQRDRSFLVCNCCPSTQSGRHWIAVFYDRGQVEFFDSFGLPPNAYDARIVTFLANLAITTNDVLYNSVQLQSIESDACGHYCVLYGVARSRGDTFRGIVAEMKAMTRDNIIKYIVNTLC